MRGEKMEIKQFEDKYWVKAEDILRLIENLRKTNDIYLYSADDLFTMLEKAIKWGEDENERR